MKQMSQASKMPVCSVQPSAKGADTEIVFVFQDSNKKAIIPKGVYKESIERLRKSGSFSAGYKSLLFLRFSGKKGVDNVLLVGTGPSSELTEEKMRVLGGLTYSKLLAEKSDVVTLSAHALDEAQGLKSEPGTLQLVRSFVEGITIKAYSFDKHKTKTAKDEDKNFSKLILITGDRTAKTHLTEATKELADLSRALDVARDWSNEPSNFGTPEYYASQAQKLSKEYGLKCTVLNEKEAAKEKMGLFLAVGEGSEREGRMVIVEYNPKGVKNPKTIVLVGKGVTFDSGGISIKPSAKMEEMIHDMSGASTMMGAILYAASLKVPNRIVAIMAFTENMPDGAAVQPGNIVTARSGKTVEIINTDAEGRLVLADALDYAHQFKPDVIIDAATLTGACGVALGRQCCAILGNDEDLIQSLRRIGEAEGERMWQMPLFDEYFEDMKSDHADMRNHANDPMGGLIRGAVFLKQFIKPGMTWAHLDIAYMATDVGHIPYFPRKGASGMYVRSLAKFAAEF